MEILTTQLPSGGYKYPFTTVSISPMNFLQITKYLENCPQDPLEKYLYDIRLLKEEDPNIQNCYVMDLDFLIFLKKLITVSDDLTLFAFPVLFLTFLIVHPSSMFFASFFRQIPDFWPTSYYIIVFFRCRLKDGPGDHALSFQLTAFNLCAIIMMVFCFVMFSIASPKGVISF